MNPRYKIVFTAMVLVSSLTFAESVRCQAKKSPDKAVRSTKKPGEDRAHWKFLLDSLIVETRLVDPEEERPVVMADLADAYWLIDQQQAKKLFTEAFEAALAVKKDPPVARVVSRIARRDRQLATQARQVADRIDSLEQRAAVIQFINYDEAMALIERDDLIRALERVEKVAAKEQRAVLYVRVATAALKKADKAMVLDALNRAGSLVRDSEDVQLQVGVLVSVGGVYARFDPAEATYATRESIKAVNRSDVRVDEPFSVFRQVNLACVGEISMQASNEKVETFNFYETLGAIAKTDAQAEGALALASEVQNRATRIRAQLAIVKAVVK